MSKYNFELDLKSKNSLSILLEFIEPNSTILEFGSSHGRLTRHLKENLHCTVDIIELNDEAGKDVAQYARNALVGAELGNIENYKWQKELEGNLYDYIIFADVLEHLYNPEKALAATKEFLKETGQVLISVPNVGHDGVLLELFNEQFNYRPTGLLDDTHIRFFTYSTLLQLIDKAGFIAINEDAYYADVIQTEFSPHLQNNSAIDCLLNQRTFGSIYQFVFALRPNDDQLEVKKLDSSKKSHFLATLYIKEKNDKNFTEEKSIKAQIDGAHISVDISLFPNAVEIRLDPCEYSAAINIIDHSRNIVYREDNAVIRQHNRFVFNTPDPQIVYSLVDSPDTTISFTIELTPLTGNIVDQCIYPVYEKNRELICLITEYENHITDQQNQITDQQNQITDQQCQIASQQNQIADQQSKILQQQTHINSLYSSRSWKITKPLRTSVGYIKSSLFYRGLRSLKNNGFIAFCVKTKEFLLPNILPNKNILYSHHEDNTNVYIKKIDGYINNDPIVKAVVFYLPQFHPFKENDLWWGKGFTEWTNVSKAKPQFIGHYQPHLPDELGFYDLRLTSEIMGQQIDLAKLYGIHGFCFYHYWFDGKKLMEMPVNNFLKDKSLDINFCLCWANENWSRRWDGLDNDILIAQNHSFEDDNAFFEDILPALKDPRYIRIDNKPILLVYRVNLLPNPENTAALWREKALESGLEGLYLIAVNSFDITNPKEFNFDACVEFPPHQLGIVSSPLKAVTLINPDYEGSLYDYALLPNQFGLRESDRYTQFKCVMPSWDNEARKPNKGTTFINSSPSLYKAWLKNALNITLKKRKEEQLLFINAWNEWAEGTHLEPCKKYGYAYLEATREILCDTTQSILLVTHDCHPHGAQFLILSMAKELKKLGYSINIVTLGDGPLLNDFVEVGSVTSFFQKDNNYVRNQLINLYKTTKDVITNTVVSGQIVEQLNAVGFNIISLIHELPSIINEYKQEKNAENIAKFSHKIVFPAKLVKERFCEITPIDENKIIIQHQGLLRKNPYKNKFSKAHEEVCKKHNLSGNTEIILNVAYADSRKGVDLFIEIASNVIKLRPNAVFIWVGHQAQDYSEIVKQRNLEKSVYFIGFDKNPMMYYAAAAAYALTSREDPFPNVVLESIEVGVPVIAFKGATGAEDYILAHKGKIAKSLDTADFSNQLCTLLDEKNKIDVVSYSLNKYCIDLLNALAICPKISVIIPNYNYGHHIVSRLESIFKQDFPIYEVIILDDKSTDNSIKTIKSFLEDNQHDAQLIINNENSGSVFKQWKRGAELAQGDIIWIAEADDLSAHNFLSELAPSFKNPEVVLAFSQSKQIDEKNGIISESYLDYTQDISSCYEKSYQRNGAEEISDTLCIKNTIPNVSGVLFKRIALVEVLEELGDDILQYQVAGDWIIYLHLLLKGKIHYNCASLNLHRRHTISVTQSTKKEKHLNEVIKAQKIAENLVELSERKKEIAANYIRYLYDHFNILQPKD